MTHMAKTMTKHNNVVVWGLVVVAVMSFTWVRFAPVTAFMGAEFQPTPRGEILARVKGYKIRNCELVKGSFVGWYRADDVWVETAFEFVNDLSHESTRPSEWSRQSFGLWQWSGVPDSATRVRLSQQHNCNGYLLSSVSADFRISR